MLTSIEAELFILLEHEIVFALTETAQMSRDRWVGVH